MSERAKYCYVPSREMNRLMWEQRQNIRNKTGKALHPVPDNSEPWGPPPRTVAEALELSDRIAQAAAEAREQAGIAPPELIDP